MATSFFSVQDSAVTLSGSWSPFGAPTSFGGHHLMHRIGAGSQIDLVMTGTDCSVNVYGSNGSFSVTVDAVTASPTLAGSGSVENAVLFSGLADAAHIVTLKVNGGSDFFIDQDSANATHCSFALTGASPAIASASGFGPQTVFSGTAAIAEDTGYSSVTAQGYNCFLAAWTGPSVRLYAACSTLKFWAFGNGQTYKLRIDGVDQSGHMALPNDGAWQWATVGSGLNAAVEHLYQITMVGGSNAYLYALMTLGGTGLNTGKVPAARKSLAGYGDSITAGTSSGFADVAPAFLHQLGLLLNSSVVDTGIAATPVGGGSSQAGQNRTADITGIAPAPDACFILYGTNDMAGVGIAAQTASQLQATYQTMMQALVTGAPSTQFFCLSILPRIDFTAAQIAPYNAAIQAAIAAVSPHSKITFVDTAAWNMGGAAYSGGGAFDSALFVEGLHPNASGYLFMRDKLAPFLAAASPARVQVVTYHPAFYQE